MSQEESTFDKLPFSVDQLKLICEHCKHISTLNTGAIVALVAFYEKFSKQPIGKWLVALALIAFVVSTGASAMAQFFTIRMMEPEPSSENRQIFENSTAASWVGFAAGMFFLAIFALLNLLM